MKDKDRKIGEIVKNWLYQKRITQVGAAKKMGIRQSSLSQMLSNRIPFPVNRLQELIKICTPPQDEINEVFELLFREHIPANFSESMLSAPNDSELEILKRDAKLAQCRLQIAYLERKVKRLQELNFKGKAGLVTSAPR